MWGAAQSYDAMAQRTGSKDAVGPALAAPIDLEHDPCAADRRVVSLLLAQIESADVVILNKSDLSSGTQLNTARVATAALTSVAMGGGILGDTHGRREDARILGARMAWPPSAAAAATAARHPPPAARSLFPPHLPSSYNFWLMHGGISRHHLRRGAA